MDAGQLNRRITIQTPTVAADAYGKNGSRSYADTYLDLPAKFEPLYGSENDTQNKRQVETGVKFIIRFRSDLNTRMRVVYGGQNYDIERVSEHPFGFKMFTEIYCRRGA